MTVADTPPNRERRGAASVWVVMMGAVVSVLVMGFGLLATRDVHTGGDPEFCASCHSVEATLDSLAAGGHEELSCLACHSTSFGNRFRSGVAQLMGAEVPEEHPTFSNRVSCAECHSGAEASSELRIEGIAVHEAHLLSSDPEVAGMACTSCHTVDDHGFAPTTSGCSASRCHSDVEVRLGGMAHEPLDCADCHALPDTIVPGDSVPVLAPSATQCLSCHAMQDQIPDHDTAGEPHGDACSWCHKPHEHATPQEAALTCTGAGCHTRPDTLVAAHRGLSPGILEDCTGCHVPHQAHVEQQDCRACHDAAGGLLPGVTGPPPPGTPGSGTSRRTGGVGAALLPDASPLLGDWVGTRLTERLRAMRHGRSARPTAATVEPWEAWTPRAAVARPAADTTLDGRFVHEDHTTVDCLSCHTPDGTEHGELVVVTASDCRSCHHVADDAPECVTCHSGPEPGGSGIVRAMGFDLSVLSLAADRDVPFSHLAHADEDCATCHLPSLTRTAVGQDCQGCHVEHHEAATDCSTCHVAVADEEHPIAQVHVGCGGAGCHTDAPAPIDDRLRDRATCLACHTELATEHYDPAVACSTCHILPPAHRRGDA